MGQTVSSVRSAAIGEDCLAALVEQSRAERARARLSCEIARHHRAHAWDCRESAVKQARLSIESVRLARRLCSDRSSQTGALPPRPQPHEASPPDQPVQAPSDFSEPTSVFTLNPHDLTVKLFDIGLMIASCRTLANDDVTPPLNAAGTMLDQLIGEIGIAAFECRPDAPGVDGAPPSISPQQAVWLLLKEASLTIDGLLQTALCNSEATAVDLTDASQAVHRAMIVACSSRDRRGKEPSVFSMPRDSDDLWMRLLGGNVLPDFDCG